MSVKKEGDLSNGLPPDEQSGGGDNQPRPNGPDRTAELELIDAALLGDMQALSELFEHYRPDLYGFCLRRVNDHSLAEDLVQDIFLRAVTNLSSFDRSKRVWPWLATIALRMCVDLQRHRSFTHYSGDIGASVDAGEYGQSRDFLDEAMTSEEHVRLRSALDVLPKRQRRAFLLHTLDGWSYKDIASAEGISVGAVGLLISRARKKMRSAYQNGPLPAVVFPFTWMRWKLQRTEERIRPLLGFYNEGFLSACMQAACLGTVVAMVVASSHPTESLERNNETRFEDRVLSGTHSQLLQTAPLLNALSHIGTPAKAPPESQQPIAGPASSVVDDLINPNQNATPEDTVLQSITASPNYENDHTVLAVGYSSPTYILFASHDGGETWKPRPSRLLYGSKVALPPNFSQDGRIFVLGGGGLQQSDDGGDVFKTVSPIGGGGVAISPSFGRGDSKILMGEKTVFEYDANTRVTHPAFPTLSPATMGGLGYSSMAFSPNYQSDSTVFISDIATIHRCRGLICEKVESPYREPLRFRPSHRCDQVGLTYAFTPWKLLVSNDKALTFQEIQFPLEFQEPFNYWRSIYDVAVSCNTSSDPAIFVSANWISSDGTYSSFERSLSGVYRSFDAGRSWSRTLIDLPGFFGSGASKLIVTPTGRLLATGVSSGIACSVDRGETWRSRCPPEP